MPTWMTWVLIAAGILSIASWIAAIVGIIQNTRDKDVVKLVPSGRVEELKSLPILGIRWH